MLKSFLKELLVSHVRFDQMRADAITRQGARKQIYWTIVFLREGGRCSLGPIIRAAARIGLMIFDLFGPKAASLIRNRQITL
jgi:hypothetical protein